MPVFVLILSAMGIGDFTWWRWADNRAKEFPRRRWWRIALGSFVGMQLLYIVYFLFLPRTSRRVSPWVPIPALAMVYIWHLIVLPATLLWIGLAKLTSAMLRRVKAESSATSDRQISRRQALSAAAIVAPPIVAAMTVARAIPQLDDFRIRSIHLNIPGLPRNLDGLRIAHLSDFHVGRYTRKGSLPKIVEATNQLKADLVLFTGDLIDLSLDDLDRSIAAMKNIDPRHGLYLIEGNHDLIDNADEFDRRTRAAGLNLLIDEAAALSIRSERLQILGTRWGVADGDRRKAGEPAFAASIAKLSTLREPGAFPILLAHHPHTFDAAANAKFPLTLSGHTHGGQLMLSRQIGFGPLFYRYWSGVYEKQASKLIVSNGVGNWFPLRINAPAEIIDLTLHATPPIPASTL